MLEFVGLDPFFLLSRVHAAPFRVRAVVMKILP
jgi:hypothetical protein